MKTFLSILILSALCMTSAIARIGETEAQIEARYGKCITVLDSDPPFVARGYESKGLFIIVEFENGVSRSEGFRKTDRSALSENEIAMLLEANKGGFNWLGHLDELPPGNRGWCSTDKKSRIALYGESEHRLIISSRDFFDRKETRRKEKEQEKLKNF